MTLRRKLFLAQLPLALSLVLTGLVSRHTVRSLDRSSQAILEDNYESVLAAERMRDAADRLGQAALAHARARPARPDLDGAEAARAFERELRFQEGNITEAGERELTARLRADWERFSAEHARAMAAPPAEAEAAFFQRLAPLEAALEDEAGRLVALNQDAMVRKSDEARRSAERMNGLILFVTLAALAAGIAATGLLTHRLLRPLSVLSQAVRRLGQGDLAARVRLSGEDELAQLSREVNTMAERLAEYRSSSLGELLEAEQAAQATIDSLPDPVLVIAFGGALRNVNRAAEELFSIDEAAPSGDGALARAPAEVRLLVEKVKEHVSAGKGAYLPKGLEEAVPIPLADGTRYFLARGSPVLDEDGRLYGLTLLFQDVTRLRRFDELKTDLVATVAHEFRTPLTSLRMAIHLCAEGAVGPLTTKQADLLFAARDDCERLQGIVDDLLDLSRIQAGRIELHRRSVGASSLLERAVDAHAAEARERGLRLEVGAPTVDRPVSADPERVQLVLANLIANAMRHTPAGGRIELRAAPDRAGQLRFEVSDTGAGIAPEHLPRLFERFYRVPGAPAGGAGLGLYIVKEIVEAHAGRVGVESEPGQGSSFWFTLPAAAQAPS